MADGPLTDIYNRLTRSKGGWCIIAISLAAAGLFAIWTSLPDEIKKNVISGISSAGGGVAGRPNEQTDPSARGSFLGAGNWEFVSTSKHRIVWNLVAVVDSHHWTASGSKLFVDGAPATVGEKNTTLAIEVDIVGTAANGTYREETPVKSFPGRLKWTFSNHFSSLAGRMFTPDGTSDWPISGVLREPK